LGKNNLSNRTNKGFKSVISVIGYLIFAFIPIVFILLAFLPAGDHYINALKLILNNKEFISSFYNSLLYGILSSLLYGFVTITLAFPLIFKTKLFPLFLVVMMTLSNNLIGGFIFARILGMAYTIYPVVMGTGLSVIGAFALHFIIKDKFTDTIPNFKQYLKAAIIPVIAIMILSFIVNWGSYYYQYAFINKKSLYGIGLFSWQFFASNSLNSDTKSAVVMFETVRSVFLLLTSIIPVSLGVLLISLNKYFPLSAFGANIRKG
jgi:hypothetical protein